MPDNPPVELIINRPFAFSIVLGESDLVAFIGIVA